MSPAHATLLRVRRPAMAGVTAIAVCAVPLAASASAANRPAATSASSLIVLNIKQPASTEAFVRFTGGLASIIEQEIVGSSLLGDTTTPSSFSISAAAQANSGSDYLQAPTTPGTPITGTATLPAGTTMTASINGGPSVAIANGAFSIPVAGGVGGAKGAAPSIHVSPTAARPGARVRVYGVAPSGSKAGAKLTLMSKAFASTHKVAGLPAVTTRVRTGGRYSAMVRIATKTKPSTYGVTGRVGDRYLQVASLKVRA
jgi:hypothetical protein